jgi:hypothetical protein
VVERKCEALLGCFARFFAVPSASSVITSYHALSFTTGLQEVINERSLIAKSISAQKTSYLSITLMKYRVKQMKMLAMKK